MSRIHVYLQTLGLILLVLPFSSVSYAAGNGIYEISRGVGCDTTSGMCWIKLSTSTIIPATMHSCSSGDEVRFMISDLGSNAVLSVALAAFMSGKKLEIYTDGTCIAGYPKANYVTVVP